MRHTIIGGARSDQNACMKQLLMIGIDEAGRGPWTGGVFAGAVILNPEKQIQGLCDSKKLSPAKRESLSAEIKNNALAWTFHLNI